MTTTAPARTALPAAGVIAAGLTVSYLVSLAVPAVSVLTAAVLLGILAGNLPVLPAAARPGLRSATRTLLRSGVVLLGLQLAVPELLGLGAGTIAAIAVTVAVGFLGTMALGRLLRLPRGLTVLVATGFSICGASAIAAMEGVVRRRDDEVATAIALVTLYGGLAIFAVPLAGSALGLGDALVGRWAGLAVHEVAQVVAAAAPAGAAAVAVAAVVKLGRVVLLAPMVAGMSLVERRAHSGSTTRRPPLVPLFVLGFLAAAALRTTGWLPDPALAVARTATTALLGAALFGLGCAVDLRSVLRTGPRALLLGLLSTLLVAGTALGGLLLLG
ncbi:MAG TPA: putative sulfate exporter family transporter [Actinophytocola sp.]|uniref:YeiH family protein n=1 Tax=Actinophytocola sp. TaxID=1872138 RepID=UPI002DBD3C98|nr:putative sulfate exporter family transporter [Actinophytocola sp.]HEU5470210.1 putative sulfate exporter family transporter [Actinophytocola sp.]